MTQQKFDALKAHEDLRDAPPITPDLDAEREEKHFVDAPFGD